MEAVDDNDVELYNWSFSFVRFTIEDIHIVNIVYTFYFS